MVYTNNFVGCRALVRSERIEETLADCTILAYDRTNIIITVNASRLQNHVEEKVSILIFGKETLFEYGGTIRRYNSNGNTEIALFRGKVKESRAFRRYPLKAMGNIIAVKEEQKQLELERILPVELINISATGVLFRANKWIAKYYLKMGNQIRLVLDVSHNKMEMECIIIRTDPLEDNWAKYACKFAVVEKVT